MLILQPTIPTAIEPLLAPLDAEQRAMLAEAPRANRISLIAQLLRMSESEVTQKIAHLLKLNVADQFVIPEHATSLLPLKIIHEFQCLPLEKSDTPSGVMDLVTLWPTDPMVDEWVYAVTGKLPRWNLAPPKWVTNTLTQNFGVGADSLSESDIASEDSGRMEDEAEDENAALIRFVNEVITKALDDRATDIHFEPLKESLQIRYRIDGELVPIRVPDNLIRYQSAIISRLKIMSKLNISEKRRPQDGRINFRVGKAELDIRISTMPTMYGESVSLRLLNQKNQPLSMSELGMSATDQSSIGQVLDLPHGIILVTGPTGSGKSTSLTAFIRQINSPGRRIITVEDPVEYEVEGVNQTQVHAEIGFTFASALRHILRQDPDVIMVGEIRDRETADIAIRASLTGHLVLSTLHTNDAPGALTRLIDMDIEPFLIASAVELIIAQRLVRRLCPQCRRPSTIHLAEKRNCLHSLLGRHATAEELQTTVYDANGCESCRGLGFRGRVGLFEILRVDEDIHELIVKKSSARQMRTTAIANGMATLQESAWNQVRLGLTTFSEVMRFAKFGDDENSE
jgi:type II secretory ATPase GspE/PulE/Tfp pilus assembly ATPase PilB-like protein